MKKILFPAIAFAAMLVLLPSCGSNTVDGNPDYFTQGMISLKMEDESNMYFMDRGNGEAMVTYDRTNPIHLNEGNAAKITTYVGDVAVPESFMSNETTYIVKEVDEMAFANNTSLTSLSLPETINKLGQGAFANCSAMATVNIPSQTTEIPSACFAQCKKLSKVVLPSAVKAIGALAFANCSRMATLTFPEGLESIGDRALLGCTNIKEITLPSTTKSIGGNAFFRASKLTKIHVLATTPPELSDSLGDYISKATLYVPKGTKSDYEAKELWKKFKLIVEE